MGKISRHLQHEAEPTRLWKLRAKHDNAFQFGSLRRKRGSKTRRACGRCVTLCERQLSGGEFKTLVDRLWPISEGAEGPLLEMHDRVQRAWLRVSLVVPRTEHLVLQCRSRLRPAPHEVLALASTTSGSGQRPEHAAITASASSQVLRAERQ